MTLNNLSEQLPWLLRNPKLTRPSGFPVSASSSSSSSAASVSGASASASLTRPAGAFSSTALPTSMPAAHSPTTAALISSFRKEPPPPKQSAGSSSSSSSTNYSDSSCSKITTVSSNATAVGTPHATNANLPTPALTGSTLFPSLRPASFGNSNSRDQHSSDVSRNSAASANEVNRAVRQQPPPPPFPSITTGSMASDTPRRGHQQPALPSISRLAPPAATRELITPSRNRIATAGHSTATPAIPSSHTRRAKTPVAPSPFALDFGSDLDPDDFDSIVDLTTDDNMPTSSSPHTAPREDVRLWREDFASRPEPPSSSRGKKRKSMEAHVSPQKSTPASKRKARVEQKRQQAKALAEINKENESDGGDDSDNMSDFPDNARKSFSKDSGKESSKNTDKGVKKVASTAR
ncbi:MAG: ATP-dependent DNA helicase sgs1 [Sporothrix thermara]